MKDKTVIVGIIIIIFSVQITSAYQYSDVKEYHRGNMNPEWCSIFDGDVFREVQSLDKTSEIMRG